MDSSMDLPGYAPLGHSIDHLMGYPMDYIVDPSSNDAAALQVMILVQWAPLWNACLLPISCPIDSPMNCSMDFMLNWQGSFVKEEVLRDMILSMQQTMYYPIMNPLLFKLIRV